MGTLSPILLENESEMSFILSNWWYCKNATFHFWLSIFIADNTFLETVLLLESESDGNANYLYFFSPKHFNLLYFHRLLLNILVVFDDLLLLWLSVPWPLFCLSTGRFIFQCLDTYKSIELIFPLKEIKILRNCNSYMSPENWE